VTEEVANLSERNAALDEPGRVLMPEVVTDATTVTLAQYAFDAWGRRTLLTGVDATNIGYTGHRKDTSGSLSLTLNRAYDADLGRWLSEDPIGMPDGPNMYAYVANRAVVWNDPLGDGPRLSIRRFRPCGSAGYAEAGSRSEDEREECLLAWRGGDSKSER